MNLVSNLVLASDQDLHAALITVISYKDSLDKEDSDIPPRISIAAFHYIHLLASQGQKKNAAPYHSAALGKGGSQPSQIP